MKISKGLTSRALGAWIFFTVLLAAIPLTAWLIWFGGRPVSGDPNDWATLASFITGMLSPILAFAGFIGLLLTVREQSVAATSQAKFSERQHRRAEAESLLTQVEGCLDHAYAVFTSTDWDWDEVHHKWRETARQLLLAQALSDQIDPTFLALRTRSESMFERTRSLFVAYLRRADVRYEHDRTDTFGGGDSCEAVDGRAVKVVSDFVKRPSKDVLETVGQMTHDDVSNLAVWLSGAKLHYGSVLQSNGGAPHARSEAGDQTS